MGSYICCEHISYDTSNMRLQIWCKSKYYETLSMMQAPQKDEISNILQEKI